MDIIKKIILALQISLLTFLYFILSHMKSALLRGAPLKCQKDVIKKLCDWLTCVDVDGL